LTANFALSTFWANVNSAGIPDGLQAGRAIGVIA
jgi:hypothetical protein